MNSEKNDFIESPFCSSVTCFLAFFLMNYSKDDRFLTFLQPMKAMAEDVIIHKKKGQKTSNT
jgi:hypothetical protein